MRTIQEVDVRDFFFEAISSYGFVTAKKELYIEGLRIDIFAIDKNHNPYIIEFKKSKNKHIVGQAAQYLAIVPSYKEELSKKINFYTINWENLNIILIAPGFFDRDLTAGNYDPLKNRVHFYTYKVVKTLRKDIFGIPLTYLGPNEQGPIILPNEIGDENDLIDLYKFFDKLDTRESKREYYSNHIIPLF